MTLPADPESAEIERQAMRALIKDLEARASDAEARFDLVFVALFLLAERAGMTEEIQKALTPDGCDG